MAVYDLDAGFTFSSGYGGRDSEGRSIKSCVIAGR
jgi:hypothetical protein